MFGKLQPSLSALAFFQKKKKLGHRTIDAPWTVYVPPSSGFRAIPPLPASSQPFVDCHAAAADVSCHIATCWKLCVVRVLYLVLTFSLTGSVPVACMSTTIVRLCAESSKEQVARTRGNHTHHKERLNGVGQRNSTIISNPVSV